MHGMVAIADRAETIPFTPAPRARGQRERSVWSQSFCVIPSEKRPFERPSAPQQSRLGSCSRDPIGYVDGLNTYTYVNNQPLDHIDPSGNVAITCFCRNWMHPGSGMPGQKQEWTAEVDCGGLASSCCNSVCGFGNWGGKWKIVPGQDAWDESEKELQLAYFEITLCCVPTPCIGSVPKGVKFCSNFLFRAELGTFKLPAKIGPYVTKYHWHMGPGKGLMKYHLPYEFESWWKNFLNNCKKGKW